MMADKSGKKASWPVQSFRRSKRVDRGESSARLLDARVPLWFSSVLVWRLWPVRLRMAELDDVRQDQRRAAD